MKTEQAYEYGKILGEISLAMIWTNEMETKDRLNNIHDKLNEFFEQLK